VVGETLDELGLAASSTERASLALSLQVWEGASSIKRGLIGRIGGLSRLDTSDVEATTSRGSNGLLGELAQQLANERITGVEGRNVDGKRFAAERRSALRRRCDRRWLRIRRPASGGNEEVPAES